MGARAGDTPGGAAARHVQFPAVTSPGPINYKGEPLEAERGPGLGCFRFQLIILVAFIILTPLSVAWGWPDWLSAGLLLVVILLLLVAGQTIIFLLRLVAADRRSRRRPLRSGTKTVGEIEDASAAGAASVSDTADAADIAAPAAPNDAADEPSDDEGPVRQ